MSSGTAELDEQIERLRKGDTLAENEVKALCDKVSIGWKAANYRGIFMSWTAPFDSTIP